MKSVDPLVLEETLKKASPLHAAIKTKDLLLVEHIIQSSLETDLNNANNSTWPPLHTAVFSSTPEIVKCLLDSGADINLAHGGNVTPLYFASSCGNAEMVRLLISSGANVNAVDELGDSPLKMAAIGNHLEVVDLLIGAGADTSRFT